METIILILSILVYLFVAWVFWKMFPYTLSFVDEMNMSPIGRFFSRFLFAFVVPPMAALIIFSFFSEGS